MKNLKSFLLIISLIFFLNIFSVISFATLYVIQDIEGNVIMITNIENIKANYLSSGYTIYILGQETPQPSPEYIELMKVIKKEMQEFENQKKLESKPITKIEPKATVKIIDWTNYLSDTGNYIYVEGVLQNTSKIVANFVRVNIQALDSYGKLISLKTSYSDPYTLNSNQKATFSTMITNNPNIKKFNLTVLWD